MCCFMWSIGIATKWRPRILISSQYVFFKIYCQLCLKTKLQTLYLVLYSLTTIAKMHLATHHLVKNPFQRLFALKSKSKNSYVKTDFFALRVNWLMALTNIPINHETISVRIVMNAVKRTVNMAAFCSRVAFLEWHCTLLKANYSVFQSTFLLMRTSFNGIEIFAKPLLTRGDWQILKFSLGTN